MSVIKDEVEQMFVGRKGIKGVDIRKIVELYDKKLLHDEIQRKLQVNNITVTYLATLDITVPALITRTDDKNVQVSVNPRLMLGACKSATQTPVELPDCAIMITENIIVQLCLLFWGYERSTDRWKLFHCVLRQLFGENRFIPTYLDIGAPKGTLQWSENSCYLDSLLAVLFFEESGTWREALFGTNVDNIPYIPEGVCDIKGGSSIDTTEKIAAQAKAIQVQLRADYDRLSTGATFACSLVRTLLWQCLPSMKENERWTVYNVAAVYDLFTEFFPTLKIEYKQSVVKFGQVLSTDTKRIGMFQMTDFMGEYSATDDTHPEIDWMGITAPVLAFYNGGTGAVRRFDSSQSEPLRGSGHFGLTILNERYKLVGVVTLLGRVHYISYFKSGDVWYHYDDTHPRGVERLTHLPKQGVWMDVGGHMPSMFFYVRV